MMQEKVTVLNAIPTFQTKRYKFSAGYLTKNSEFSWLKLRGKKCSQKKI